MIRVSQLFIKSVGPFEEQNIDFSVENGHPDIHIFIGPNGSGKTTILHSLASNFDFFENGHTEHLSNNFFKRFQIFEEDKNEMARSYVHSILHSKENFKPIEKIVSYGCHKCGSIHQNFEKTAQNNSKIKKTGKGYKTTPLSKEITTYKSAIIASSTPKKDIHFAAFGYSGYRLINSASNNGNESNGFNPLKLALEFKKKTGENNKITDWIISRYSKAAIEETHGNKEIADTYRTALNCLMNSISELTNNEYTFKIKTNPLQVVINYYDNEVEFDVLPDGLRSLLGWMGDLLMRLDQIPWANKEIPVNEQDMILFLDEIEVHLHPKWQYQILPLTRKIFPNAQIFLSTHSPFVLNSIDNAKIYKLNTGKGISKLEKIILSETGDSYEYIYENILDTHHKFGPKTTLDLKRFEELDQELVLENFENEEEFKKLISRLKDEGEEVTSLISSKIFRLKEAIGKDYFNGEDK